MNPIVLYALVTLNGGNPQITLGLTAEQCIFNRSRGAGDICAAYMPKTQGATLFLRPTRGGFMDQWRSVKITPNSSPPLIKWEDRWKTNPEALPPTPMEDCESLKSGLDPSTSAICAPVYMPEGYCGS
jgi:hypothetical protein